MTVRPVSVTYLSRQLTIGMADRTIRTSIDIPAPLHRRLREVAAQQGCSARQLIS